MVWYPRRPDSSSTMSLETRVAWAMRASESWIWLTVLAPLNLHVEGACEDEQRDDRQQEDLAQNVFELLRSTATLPSLTR